MFSCDMIIMTQKNRHIKLKLHSMCDRKSHTHTHIFGNYFNFSLKLDNAWVARKKNYYNVSTKTPVGADTIENETIFATLFSISTLSLIITVWYWNERAS